MKRSALFALLALMAGIYFGGCVDIGDKHSDLGESCSNSDGCQGDLRCILNVCVEVDENGKPLPGPDGKPLVNACGDAACGVDPFGNVCGTCSGDASLCSGGMCVEADGCDYTGFAPTAQAALIRKVGGKNRVRYIATSGAESPPYDKLVIEFDHEKMLESGSPSLGTFDLSLDLSDPTLTSKDKEALLKEQIVDCERCTTAFTYCNTSGCFNEYYIEEGQMEVIQGGEPGTSLTLKMTGVVLREFRRKSSDNMPKEFANGKKWCLGDFSIDIQVPEIKEAEGFCVPDGTGKNVNDNIGDFTLTNCFDEEVNLHDFCANSAAVWVVYTTGW